MTKKNEQRFPIYEELDSDFMGELVSEFERVNRNAMRVRMIILAFFLILLSVVIGWQIWEYLV